MAPPLAEPVGADLVGRLAARLPQTQCRGCGYPDCAAYARALAGGECMPDRCVAGGDATATELGRLSGIPVAGVDPRLEPGAGVLATIDESRCIGCTLCMRACPVDAIIGARGRMHSVVAAECTGCGLCVAPCPVDCVLMDGAPLVPPGQWLRERAPRALSRYRARARRIASDAVRADRTVATPARGEMRAAVDAAVARVRARRARSASGGEPR